MNKAVIETVWRRLPKPSYRTIQKLRAQEQAGKKKLKKLLHRTGFGA